MIRPNGLIIQRKGYGIMADKKFGIFAIELRLKVTNEVKTAGKVLIIPCSMGFKQQDATWVNEWVDVTIFSGDVYEKAQQISKGDQITVTGRMNLRAYKGKTSWSILCDNLSVDGQPSGSANGPEEDIPF